MFKTTALIRIPVACRALLGGCLLLLSGCTSAPGSTARDAGAAEIAAAAGLVPFVTNGTLPLQGYARAPSPGAALVVYIEGDGRAWIDRYTPSSDPTPVNPVALRLAALDPAPNVVYLGRPGQYLHAAVARKYWLDARFAPEVVDAYVEVIRARAAALAAPAIHLVGYSGGGAVAVLVAARLHRDAPALPLTLRTIAGNLDIATWARTKKLTPLDASLNPAEVAGSLIDVPQLHLVGLQDRQVPRAVLDAYLAHMATRRCVQIRPVETGHPGPWEDAWRTALDVPLACAP